MAKHFLFLQLKGRVVSQRQFYIIISDDEGSRRRRRQAQQRQQRQQQQVPRAPEESERAVPIRDALVLTDRTS